jgi:hypothetical protein
VCRSVDLGLLAVPCVGRPVRCRPPVDTPTDTVKAHLPTPGPSGAGKTHGVWLPSATIADSDYIARQVLLSNVFCGSIWSRDVPRWFRRIQDFELAHAGRCRACRGQQISRHRGQDVGVAGTRRAEAPNRSVPPRWSSLGHPGSDMANVTNYRLESTSTTDVSMRYSNRRTRNASSVAGAVHDGGLARAVACGRRRLVSITGRRWPAG